ncbi:MAG: phosphopantetheine adenylyltransferase [ANME-2 cluster archaeon]|nr:phosphopantetheine adenylyltransferase [ANME-2 cluster archaeon]MCL7476409.1 phosphopantetheine adenylyltransferase [ANME-2 cluster archaeon]MDF1531918.1 phosphopantetheine adenylyltransferase [ANME-2 cluster archaeon]MDW7777285.1 phosphopantetheine adenylyltransferase [Methanosarcinales archaeon]
MSRVAVGGTFNPLHDGHRALLARAYQLSKGGELLIGITSNEMAGKKYHEVEDWEVRKQEVTDFMQETFNASPFITRLDDPFGPAIDEDFDYLVVSPETEPTAHIINTRRTEQGKEPISIELVKYVLADDGQPISSTRVLQGEIDIHGNLLQHR